MQEDPDIRQRLTAVVQCLIDYKAILINKNTLNITVPADLQNNTRPLLTQSCNIIKDFMIRHERPSEEDAELKACLDCLDKALSPWNPDMSILCPEFCDKIFDGFNLNKEKILNEIDLYCPVDGVSADEPQSS